MRTASIPSRRLLLAAACALVAAMAPPALAPAASMHWLHKTAKMHMPAVKHHRTVYSMVQLPRLLDGFYLYMQYVYKGKPGHIVPAKKRMTLTRKDGSVFGVVSLHGRYSRITGKLRVDLKLDNISYKRHKSNKAVVRIRVTVGYRG